MTRLYLFAGIAVAVILAVILLRPKRHDASPTPPPAPVATVAPGPSAPALKKAPAERDRSALGAFLAKVGRAALLHDRRELDGLIAGTTLYVEDMPWIAEQAAGRDTLRAMGAVEILGRYRRLESIPVLKGLLSDSPSIYLREAAALALGRMKDGMAEAALIAGLYGSNQDSAVRAAIVRGLAMHPTADSYEALAGIMANDPHPGVRRAAAEAIALFPGHDEARLAALLQRLTNEPDAALAARLVSLAYHVGGEAAVPAIQQAIAAHAALKDALDQTSRIDGPERYERVYEKAFFEKSAAIEPEPALPIGITVDGSMPLTEVAAAIFSTPPLDRYRKSFYLRLGSEFEADLLAKVAYPRAYDSYGRPLSGAAVNDLDGTVVIHVKDAASFQPGIIGYTEGNEAYVTKISLLHEIGHALAELGDEYESTKATPAGSINVSKEGMPWAPLIAQGHLPAGPILRKIPGGTIPSLNCHMANRPADDRFCPVCQLEIIARVCEKTGAKVPW